MEPFLPCVLYDLWFSGSWVLHASFSQFLESDVFETLMILGRRRAAWNQVRKVLRGDKHAQALESTKMVAALAQLADVVKPYLAVASYNGLLPGKKLERAMLNAAQKGDIVRI